MQTRILTGISTTGTPHLGNYIGALRPAIQMQVDGGFYFLADLHALVKCQDSTKMQKSCYEVVAAWLALGLDTQKCTLYRQSDISEILQLAWILTCIAAKGELNRAHAYKDSVASNLKQGVDQDKGINMGLFSYPILMAADILLFRATDVPVGQDQIQHIEMARDWGQRFNHIYGDIMTLPKAQIDKRSPILQGLDGRKMSKSYDNTIPLFCSQKTLKKLINSIQTDSLAPGDPKDPDNTPLVALYSAFADASNYRNRLAEGLGWGDAKRELFELIDSSLSVQRQEYERLVQDTSYLDGVLSAGALKARDDCACLMQDIRAAIGL